MSRNNNSRSLRFHFIQHQFQLFDRMRVKAYQRLVKQYDFRLGKQRTAYTYFLLHTFRKFLAQFIDFVLKLQSVHQFLCPVLPVFKLIGTGYKFHMLPYRQKLKRCGDLRHIAQDLLCLDTFIFESANLNFSLKAQQTCNTFYCR